MGTPGKPCSLHSWAPNCERARFLDPNHDVRTAKEECGQPASLRRLFVSVLTLIVRIAEVG